MVADRIAVTVVGLVTLGFLLTLLVPAASGRVPTAGDLAEFHLPLRAFYAHCLANGQSPVWCPDHFNGFDLHGEGQIGLFHPVHLILYATLPLVWAFALECALPMPLALLGMVVWLRGRGLPLSGAALAGLSFASGGFLLGHLGHTNGAQIVAHVPWLLAALDAVVLGTTPMRRALGGLALGLLTASELLLGYPMYVFTNGLAELVVLAWSARSLTAWFRVGLAKLLGVMIGLVQLLPTAAALAASYRADPDPAFRSMLSLPPVNLLQPACGYYVQLDNICSCEAALYAGLAAALGIFWIAYRPRGALAGCLLTLAGLGIFLALGRFNPLFGFYSELPLLRTFRCPCRFSVLLQLATAASVAILWRDLAAGDTSSGRRFWPLVAVIGLALAPLVLPVPRVLEPISGLPMAYTLPPGAWAWALGGIGLFTAVVLSTLHGWRGGLIALALWVGADQTLSIRRLGQLGGADVETLAASVGLPAEMQPGQRVYRLCLSNLPALAGVRQTFGYLGLYPSPALPFPSEPAMRVSGVAWADLGQGWEAVRDPLPRARLLTDVRPSQFPSVDLATIDPATTALVNATLDMPEGHVGEANLHRDEPGEIHVRTSAASRQLLVVSERWTDGWRATIDGQTVPVHLAYGSFLACDVPAGKHEVVFTYRPRSLRWGAGLALAGLALLLVWTVAEARHRS